VQFIEPHLSWAQQLVQRAQARAARVAVSVLGPELKLPELSAVAGRLGPYASQLEQLARFSQRGKLYAYCFCSAN
jgi:hypothetical protein